MTQPCLYCDDDSEDGICDRCHRQRVEGVDPEWIGGCDECRQTAWELAHEGHRVDCSCYQ